MKKNFLCIVVILAAMALLVLVNFSLGRAQQLLPPGQARNPSAPDVRSDYIPIQGRLTDPDGVALSGTYTVTYRIYNVRLGGAPLCTDDSAVKADENGLFTDYMNFNGCSAINGQQLYLGIVVGTDPEMTPRQYIDNVPYAWSLRPGAVISASLGGGAVLEVQNYGNNGRGLRSYAMAESGVNYGVVGASVSPDGFGGYFYNNGGGVGLYGQSDTGAAIKAGGTGIIRSTAKTYLWFSGNGLRPTMHGDSTYIDSDGVGGAKIRKGADMGAKNVFLPITIPSVLYGQNVRITALDIYYLGETEFDAITGILLRRQTGVCDTCFATILNNSTSLTCDHNLPENINGCSHTYSITTNNTLTADSGNLYLLVNLSFSGASTYFDIGGVRLTLEYNQ